MHYELGTPLEEMSSLRGKLKCVNSSISRWCWTTTLTVERVIVTLMATLYLILVLNHFEATALSVTILTGSVHDFLAGIGIMDLSLEVNSMATEFMRLLHVTTDVTV